MVDRTVLIKLCLSDLDAVKGKKIFREITDEQYLDEVYKIGKVWHDMKGGCDE